MYKKYIYIIITKILIMFVFNTNLTKMAPHKIFIGAVHLKCYNLDNKAIFSLICN